LAEARGIAGAAFPCVPSISHNCVHKNLCPKRPSSCVPHFATHGLLAGESEAILKAKAEPGLILTPPKDGTPPSELEEDDGLLTASEVAQLELDADWIVLSACNTAAGDKGDAEALSGLARAFFYAKARALLVSHWSVTSDAAVKLTTRAFAELRARRGAAPFHDRAHFEGRAA